MDLAVVRFLFRTCLAPVFETVGSLEKVLQRQNDAFTPQGEDSAVHFSEYVSIFDQKQLAGGTVCVEGIANYTVWTPTAATLTRAERLTSDIIKKLKVGDYLRDNGPSGTGCAILIKSAVPVPSHKSSSIPGWYLCPVEIKWTSFYLET